MTPLAILAAIVNTFWLGAALTALVWLALKFARTNAATRGVIWWIVLALLIGLPALQPLASRWRQTPTAAATPAAPNEATPAPNQWRLEPEPDDIPAIVTIQPKPAATWPFAVFALWAAVFLYRTARVAQSYLYLRQMKRRSELSGHPLPNTGRNVRLLLSPDAASPLAAGFFHPAIILPRDLTTRISPEELDQILLHESAHLARRDDWSNLLARLLGAAFALHPVVWWILRQIEFEREVACDDWVVAHTGAPRAYAETLAHMAELCHRDHISDREAALASGVFGRGSRLGARIKGLLSAGRPFSARVSALRVVMGCLLLCGLAALGSSVPGRWAPTWIAFAQTPRVVSSQVQPTLTVATPTPPAPEIIAQIAAPVVSPAPKPSAPTVEIPSRKPLEFEVASIKPSDLSPGVMHLMTPSVYPGGRVVLGYISLNGLVCMAFHIPGWELSGGEPWMLNDKYDVEAKPSADLQPAITNLRHTNWAIEDPRLREMLQSLLIDRFQLKFHRDTTTGKIYLLETNGKKSGLKPTDAPNHPFGGEGFSGDIGFAGGRYVIYNTEMAQFAKFAADHILHAPVIDRTGLTGAFDYKEPVSRPDAEVDYGNPPFMELVSEIGLKLTVARGPVESFVIDRAEKPSPN